MEEDISIVIMFYACHAANVKDKEVWFLDSTCINHIASQESTLIDIDKTITCKVKMGSRDLV